MWPSGIIERDLVSESLVVAVVEGAISDLAELLRSMDPVLNPGIVVFCLLPPGLDPCAVRGIGTFREAEGMTAIVAEADAAVHGLEPLFRAAWITLTVHSDLNAVGLTAAVSAALTEAGISCNVVAGAYHDHLFVPAHAGALAMQTLEQLRIRAAPTSAASAVVTG